MRGYVPDQMPLRDDALNRTSAYRAPLVWRVPEGPGISVGQRSNTRNHAGPDCGAGGRWQGLEGYRDEAPNVSEHQVPLVWRVPEGRDCGAGGRWQGLAGLRDDAPSEARGADGERAGRRPRQQHAEHAHTTRPGPAAPNSAEDPGLVKQSDQAVHHEGGECFERGLDLALGQRGERCDSVVGPGAREFARLIEHVVGAQAFHDRGEGLVGG